MQTGEPMAAPDRDDALEPICDRPTIPVPAPGESGVRLQVAKRPLTAAVVDVVLCDLSRDARSESFIDANHLDEGPEARRRPPALSNVIALKR